MDTSDAIDQKRSRRVCHRASDAIDPEVASETAEAIDEILANEGHSDQANRYE